MSSSVERTPLVTSFFEFSFTPIESLKLESKTSLTLKDRAVLAFQALIGAITLPVIAAIGLLEAAFLAATCRFKDASETLLLTAFTLPISVICISTVVVGIFTTAKITKDFRDGAFAAFDRVVDCFDKIGTCCAKEK